MKQSQYMKKLFFAGVILLSFSGYAQHEDDGVFVDNNTKKDTVALDEKYFEDQFYLGFTYDLLVSKPENVVQHNFSRGIHLGFLKDIPVNKQRNIGFAIGLGYVYDLFYSNIVAYRANGETTYNIVESLDDEGLSKNYFETQTIEFPVEFRWRTSTAESHKFWRIYTGIRIGYVFHSKNLYEKDELKISFENNDISNKWNFKAYTTFGYNTINFMVQYNFTPLLKDAKTANGTSLKSGVLQMGVMFYIL